MGISMRNSALSNNQSQKATTNSVFSMRPDGDQIGNEAHGNLSGVGTGVDVNTVDAADCTAAVAYAYIHRGAIQCGAAGGGHGRAAGESDRGRGVPNNVIAQQLAGNVAGRDVSMLAVRGDDELVGGEAAAEGNRRARLGDSGRAGGG